MPGEDNVELARCAYQAATCKPAPDLQTISALFHHEHEFIAAFLERHYVGVEGFRVWLADMGEAWELWEPTLEQPTAIDDDRVLIIFRANYTSKGAGVPVEQRIAQIMTVRDGKIVRTENFTSVDDARKAATIA